MNGKIRRPAVFLDRDGVLTREIVRDGAAYAPTRVEDFVLVPEAGAQVQRLRDAGFICIVFTNQPELANGKLNPADLEEMHRQMRAAISLDDIYFCPHGRDDGCPCYKPKPGMIEQAVARWDIDLAASYVVGDRWRDIGAGNVTGCYSILIDRSYSGDCLPDLRVASLTEAVDAVLRHARGA